MMYWLVAAALIPAVIILAWCAVVAWSSAMRGVIRDCDEP